MADYSNPHNAYGYGYGYGDDSGYQAHRNTEGRPGPLSSPFDDDQFSYRHNQPSPSSYPSTPQGMMGAQSDPFEDDDAVPLRNYRPKHASQTSVAPIVTPEYNDPFVRDVKRQGRRRSQRDIPLQSGWFKGQITWVCFILSIIQIAVFIAELARNGKRATLWNSLPNELLTRLSCLDRVTCRDSSAVQPHDWTISLCPDQHGSTLSALHAQHAQRDRLPGDHLLAMS